MTSGEAALEHSSTLIRVNHESLRRSDRRLVEISVPSSSPQLSRGTERNDVERFRSLLRSPRASHPADLSHGTIRNEVEHFRSVYRSCPATLSPGQPRGPKTVQRGTFWQVSSSVSPRRQPRRMQQNAAACSNATLESPSSRRATWRNLARRFHFYRSPSIRAKPQSGNDLRSATHHETLRNQARPPDFSRAVRVLGAPSPLASG